MRRKEQRTGRFGMGEANIRHSYGSYGFWVGKLLESLNFSFIKLGYQEIFPSVSINQSLPYECQLPLRLSSPQSHKQSIMLW